MPAIWPFELREIDLELVLHRPIETTPLIGHCCVVDSFAALENIYDEPQRGSHLFCKLAVDAEVIISLG